MRSVGSIRFVSLIAAAAALSIATPSLAKGGKGNGGGGNTGSGATSQPLACGLNDLSIAALSCSGFYSGNLLSSAGVTQQETGLAAIGYDWNGDFNALVDAGQKVDSNGATRIGFGTLLSGITVIGIHFGGGGASGVGNGTAFYRFDAGSGIDTIGLNYPASSDVVLYSTGGSRPPSNSGTGPAAVPEPSSWALMILGFGALGSILRTRRRALSLG